MPYGCIQDGQFMGVTARLHLAEARVLVRCVERRVNICSTAQYESVQPADHLGSSVPGDEHRYAACRRYLPTVTGEVDVDVQLPLEGEQAGQVAALPPSAGDPDQRCDSHGKATSSRNQSTSRSARGRASGCCCRVSASSFSGSTLVCLTHSSS